MARDEAFSIDGTDMLIYSGDHDPPHLMRESRGCGLRVFIFKKKNQR
jgi:hypothetical protein